MTLNEALVLHDGDFVCHPAKVDCRKGTGELVKIPLRVTKVWINAKRTIVMIRVHAIAGRLGLTRWATNCRRVVACTTNSTASGSRRLK